MGPRNSCLARLSKLWLVALLCLAGLAFTFALPSRIFVTMASVLWGFGLFFLHSWWRTALYSNGQITFRAFFGVVFTTFLIMALLFGSLHFLTFQSSRNAAEHYRLSNVSRIGGATERVLVRTYLRWKVDDYRLKHSLKPGDSLAVLVDEKLIPELKSRVADRIKALLSVDKTKFPQLSREIDSAKVAQLIHDLAVEYELLGAYYKQPGELAYVGGFLEREVFGWYEALPSNLQRRGSTYAAMMILTITEILHVMDRVAATNVRRDQRELYVAFVVFSSMILVTAGFGDILPNSLGAYLIVFMQIVAYVSFFVLLVPWGFGLREKQKKPNNDNTN